MEKTSYQEIAADEVRPGDVYKFISTAGLFFIGDVVDVWDGLVKVRWWQKSEGTRWTYKQVRVGRVVFARAATAPSLSPPSNGGDVGQ